MFSLRKKLAFGTNDIGKGMTAYSKIIPSLTIFIFRVHFIKSLPSLSSYIFTAISDFSACKAYLFNNH